MRPRYKLAEVRPDDKRSLGGAKARTLSTRHARLVAMARLPRRSQIQIRIRRALIVAGKPLTTNRAGPHHLSDNQASPLARLLGAPSCGAGCSPDRPTPQPGNADPMVIRMSLLTGIPWYLKQA
jgi:hypothetical protein